IDTHTQWNKIHSCGPPSDPEGEFVTGVHVKNNLLLCSNEFAIPNIGSKEYVDGTNKPLRQIGDKFVSIHQCPVGFAVTGIHVDRNLLGQYRRTVDASVSP